MMDVLKSIPKIELHCHLDGSVRPRTMYELLLKEGFTKFRDYEEFEEMVMVKDDCKSLKEYLKKFEYPLSIMQKKENIERITYELLEDFNSQNVKYAEIRFAPYLHTKEGLSFEEVVESVLMGMGKAKKDFGIWSNVILICMRHEKVEKSIDVIQNAAKYIGKGVVAVDLAGNEHDFPPEIHEKAFNLAYEKGYNITIHAGETGIAENIPKSIELLHAKRIGHGIAAAKDPEIMELLKEKNIFLEICPISNLQTKAVKSTEDYPVRKFIEKGLKVTVNTDNPTVSNTSLEREYKLLVEKLRLTIEEIVSLIENSIDAAFLTEDERENLRKLVDGELRKLELI